MSDDQDDAPRSRGRARRPTADLPFEKAVERLERIADLLEGGTGTLEESLALFEEGVSLARRCQQRLDDAERRLEVLVQRADGSEATEPFAESDPPSSGTAGGR